MAKPPSATPVRWALQDARNRLSEVVDAALRGYPQILTRRGIDTAVILAHEEYARLIAARDETREPLAAYLMNGPTVGPDQSGLFERIELKPRSLA